MPLQGGRPGSNDHAPSRIDWCSLEAPLDYFVHVVVRPGSAFIRASGVRAEGSMTSWLGSFARRQRLIHPSAAARTFRIPELAIRDILNPRDRRGASGLAPLAVVNGFIVAKSNAGVIEGQPLRWSQPRLRKRHSSDQDERRIACVSRFDLRISIRQAIDRPARYNYTSQVLPVSPTDDSGTRFEAIFLS